MEKDIMKDTAFMKDLLEKAPHLQKHLFEKGYLITSAQINNTQDYPFFGNWECTRIGSFNFWIYKTNHLYTVMLDDGSTLFLIGHAFNPYTMQYKEEDILSDISRETDQNRVLEIIDELTGIFILGRVRESDIDFLLDASGMQCGYYGRVSNEVYISSHTRLIGDLCGLTVSDYVRRLVNYRWYHYMLGNYLPGDITCFKELTRAIPNTLVRYRDGNYAVFRFYPRKEIAMCKNKQEYKEVILESARILKNTMALIPEKWARPAISLTGGIDSNTTFAAANGNYDQYTTFSYISMYRESIDAEKAREISERFHVKHTEYPVPENNEDVPDFDIYREIFSYNGGGIGYNSESDTRKKITLISQDICEVEVKSWISETIRAYAYKYYGRTSFPKDLSPRDYTSLYKIFAADRRLAKETDRYFEEYLNHTCLKEHLFNYDESDFFVWEMMHGGKCGSDIGVMKSCWDIVIPYNNRKLMDTLLRVPLKMRLEDRHHLSLKKVMNRELYDMNIRVVNLNETDRRKRLINLYYIINTHLPF